LTFFLLTSPLADCMKSSFLLILFSLAAMVAVAQQKQKAVSDSLPAKLNVHNTMAPAKKTKRTVSTEVEIREKLTSLVSAYSNKPNSQATWTQVMGEAQNILLPYYRNGALMGTKAEQAFYVKMGSETMTQADIANHKMILHAGIATAKPAEFIIIVVEKINTMR
jgi:phage tail sheath protein FI